MVVEPARFVSDDDRVIPTSRELGALLKGHGERPLDDLVALSRCGMAARHPLRLRGGGRVGTRPTAARGARRTAPGLEKLVTLELGKEQHDIALVVR